MEIRNIITFQKIYQLNSFSKAATALGYSQSAVTMQIKQLENELEVKLFDRIGKNISLTSEGERFLHYANTIITASNHAKADLTSNPVPKGELKIGILESVCTAYLPQILNHYHSAFPEVSTIIQMDTFDNLASMLNTNRIDLLWTFDAPIENSEWKKAFSYQNVIAVICSPKHPLAKEKDLSLSDIANETFIFTEKSCSYRQLFEEYLTTMGYPTKVFLEIGNTEIIKKFVAANLGISVLPYFTLIEELTAHKLCVLELSDYQLQMQGQLFYHKNKWLSPALSTFIKQVSDYLAMC